MLAYYSQIILYSPYLGYKHPPIQAHLYACRTDVSQAGGVPIFGASEIPHFSSPSLRLFGGLLRLAPWVYSKVPVLMGDMHLYKGFVKETPPGRLTSIDRWASPSARASLKAESNRPRGRGEGVESGLRDHSPRMPRLTRQSLY